MCLNTTSCLLLNLTVNTCDITYVIQQSSVEKPLLQLSKLPRCYLNNLNLGNLVEDKVLIIFNQA